MKRFYLEVKLIKIWKTVQLAYWSMQRFFVDEGKRIKVPHYRPWKHIEDVDSRGHIFAAMVLGRGRVANLTLSCLYPQKSLSTHFTGGWVDPRAIWTWKSEEKSPLIHCPWSNLGCLASSEAPCRLCYLAPGLPGSFFM